MNFLEKDLETIIWENYIECEDRGLAIGSRIYGDGRRYRQMNLMPYGIADLVNVYYNAEQHKCWVQVIECKRGKVDANTYLQAKRYVTAIKDIFANFNFFNGVPVVYTTVLIGSEIDTNSPLVHAIAQDESCGSFIYKYGVDGIRFLDCTIHWWASASVMGSGQSGIERPELEDYLLEGNNKLHRFQMEHGNHFEPLLITPTGVSVNPRFLQL